MTYDDILIDAKNALYRAIFAGHSDKKFRESGNSPIVIILRFFRKYLQQFKPENVHIFWDTPKERVWRRELLPKYKDRKHKDHGFDVDAALNKCTRSCMKLFNLMGFFQYQRDHIEADDLIYAWCKVNLRKRRPVIISNDSDFIQIPYQFSDIILYDPLTKGGRIVQIPDLDPVEIKCFAGEATDTIPGYDQIGPKRAAIIVKDIKARKDFFEKHDRETYDRNKRLIDLSLCPELLENMNYVLDVLCEDQKFDEKGVKKLISTIKGLTGEYSNSILPFRFIKDK